MNNKKLHSFSHRITRGVFLMALANVIFVIVLLAFVRPTLINSMSNDYINNLSEFVKEDIKYTLLVQDYVTTQQYLDRVVQFPLVEKISLHSADGTIQGSIGESNWMPSASDFDTYSEVKILNSSSHRLDTIYTTKRDGEIAIAGRIHLAINGSSIIANVDRIIYLIIASLIVGSIVLWWFMRSFALKATRSIRDLNTAINSIQPDKSESNPINVVPDSIEIDNVQTGVNSLLQRIEMARTDLENRVNERTLDLASALEHNSRAEAVRRSLIMNLSHDLKTPLSSIMMNMDHAMEVIEEGESKADDFMPFLLLSRQSSALLWDEIKTLLEYSSTADTSEDIVLSEFAVAETVLRSIERTEALSAASNNKVIYKNFGRDLFTTSERLFVYVLDNLIANAHKACKGGTVMIETEITVNDLLVVRVHDNGVGIPLDERENIFEKHFQIDNSSNHGGPRGMGIGLSLAKFWIDQLGGSIELESEEGEFTQFTITIKEKYLIAQGTSPF